MFDYPISNEHQKLVDEAKRWIGTKESKPNGGKDIETFQKAVDGKAAGEPWCAAFCFFCIEQVESSLGIKSPAFKTEHVMTCWNKSPKELRRTNPKPGFLILWRHEDTSSGHMGIIYDVTEKELLTIEGNTGDGSGVVRDGDGVYLRTRSPQGSGKMKVVGYIDPFPILAEASSHQG